MSGRRRGLDREREVLDLLEAHGWVCVRSAGSHGSADVVAAVDGIVSFVPGDLLAQWPQTRFLRALLYVEVKSTAQSPFERFGPEDRRLALDRADRAGGEAWLAWWPPRKRLTWIPSAKWPASREQEAPLRASST